MSELRKDLNGSELNYKGIFKNSPIPIYIWKIVEDDLILVDFNYAAEMVTEGKIKNLIGSKVSEIYKDRPSIIAFFRRCIKEKVKISGEIKYKYITTGTEKILYNTYDFIEPDLVLLHSKDITKQREAEKSLEKEEQKKSIILENLNELIVFQDLDHKVVYANKAACESVGLTQEQLIGRKCYEIWHNRTERCEFCPVYKALTTRRPEVAEITSPDGREWIIKGYPILTEDGNLIGAAEVANDVTEQNKIKRELEDRNKDYRSLFENMNAGFAYHKIILDENNKPINYRFLEVNPAFERLTGIKVDDILGKTVTEALPGIENDPADWIGIYGKVALTGVPISFENYNEFLDMWYKVSSYSPKKGYFVAIFENITERKKADQILRESEEKYHNAYNRSNLYKDLFTHDMNNIFQNILASFELYSLYSNNPDKKENILEVKSLIKEQILRGAKLVNNVQKLSELEDIKPTLFPVEICELLQKSVDLIRNNFSHKKININIESHQKFYHVKANLLLIDIIENLIINGIKHNKNTNIEITIKISKSIIDGINYIKIEFIDNGVGIPDLIKEEIFHKEYKKKEQANGIGLGLILIKQILDSYNGKVNIEDKIQGDYSKGCNFMILIPEMVV